VTAKYLANGMRASMTWDDADRLQHLANMKSDGTTTSSFDYAYDKADNRLRVVEASAVRVSWAYDKTYQLLHEQRSGSSSYNMTYTYDPAGNRRTMLDGGVLTTYTVDAANQLLNFKDNTGTTTMTWDNNGNQLTQTTPSGARTTFGWDFENRVSRILLAAGVPNTMMYNGDGTRVQKQDSTGTAKFIWDEQNILEETDQNNVVQAVYTLKPAGFGNLLSQYRTNSTIFPLFDALGSTDRLTNNLGVITDTYIYRAYGRIQSSAGATVNPFKYIGRLGYYYDVDLVQYYLRARSYDPSSGRFINRDPLGHITGPNLYLYVSASPLNWADPAGTRLEFLGGDKDEGIKQLRQLCPDAKIRLACFPTYLVEVDATFCKNPKKSKFPLSCECICAIADPKFGRTVKITIVDSSNVKQLAFMVPDSKMNLAFKNGVNDPKQCFGKNIQSGMATAKGFADFPVTSGQNFEFVQSISSTSKWKFGAFLPNGKGFAFRSAFLILGHELCGHAWKKIGYTGGSFFRPAHDKTIVIENQLAKEHGDKNVRGLFKNAPGCGESSGYHSADKIWFWPEACLPKGLTYPKQ
jgi:RHS repeat-associated protein